MHTCVQEETYWNVHVVLLQQNVKINLNTYQEENDEMYKNEKEWTRSTHRNMDKPHQQWWEKQSITDMHGNYNSEFTGQVQGENTILEEYTSSFNSTYNVLFPRIDGRCGFALCYFLSFMSETSLLKNVNNLSWKIPSKLVRTKTLVEQVFWKMYS